jgi:hypothetical protein
MIVRSAITGGGDKGTSPDIHLTQAPSDVHEFFFALRSATAAACSSGVNNSNRMR